VSFLDAFQPNYLELFLLMVVEGLGGPIPSEVLMPLVGVWASSGQMDFVTGVLVGTLGSLVGSLVAYGIGAFFGYEVLERYGKYVGITKEELNSVKVWFAKYGTYAVFFLRFVPALRALISYPAGVGRMNLALFVVLTFLGHTIWDTALALLGYNYGQRVIAVIESDARYLYLVAAVIVIYFAYKIYKAMRRAGKGH
jgi:membrane protein DedA with SNARE-associated domain